MVAKNTVFRLFARGDCGMYRYIVPFSSLANHSRALFGVVNSMPAWNKILDGGFPAAYTPGPTDLPRAPHAR